MSRNVFGGPEETQNSPSSDRDLNRHSPESERGFPDVTLKHLMIANNMGLTKWTYQFRIRESVDIDKLISCWEVICIGIWTACLTVASVSR
jgi:hypothetical protein